LNLNRQVEFPNQFKRPAEVIKYLKTTATLKNAAWDISKEPSYQIGNKKPFCFRKVAVRRPNEKFLEPFLT